MNGLLAVIADRCEGVRWKGSDQFTSSCPNHLAHKHGDRKKSFSARATHDRVLLKCHAGCSIDEICRALGLEQHELFFDDKKKDEHGPKGHARQPLAARITVEALARDKRLPVEFLRGLGLKDIDRGVEIPYFREDGAPAARHRIRTALRAGDGSYWETDARVIVPYGLQKLAEARGAGFLVIVEGESDSWTLWHHGFPCLGIPGASNTKCLLPEHIAGIKKIFIVQEPGKGGSAFVDGLRKRFAEFHWEGEARVVSLHPHKDPNELHKTNPEMFPESFRAFLGAAQSLTPDESRAMTVGIPSRNANPWTRAVSMDVFLSGEDEPVEFLHHGMIAKGAITEIFSPRGLGKSLWAAHVAVELARKGTRVMLIDRDNPRRVVRERLQAFGATVELVTLKFLSRENAPPLTNDAAWAEFPYLEYDAIFLDSLDSSAEGVGEQDSSKPSKAIAPLLDIVRRENGPAVVVLGNCVRTAARSRGSGVVEDRADIVFEVRDATDLHPSGTKPWIEELPAGGADYWAARSSRRKRRQKYKLAFIATKFRIGEEPDPFVIEMDLTTDPWTVENVTDAVDAEGSAAREQREKEHAETISRARASLVAEILRREEAHEPFMLKKKDAVPFLTNCKLSRNGAQKLLDDPQGAWELRKIDGVKGHPVGVFLPFRPGEKGNGGRNTTPQKPAFSAGLFDADFAHPHPERPGEIPASQPVENKSVETPPISPVTTKLTSPEPASANASAGGDSNAEDRSNGSGEDDDEVRL